MSMSVTLETAKEWFSIVPDHAGNIVPFSGATQLRRMHKL